MLESLLSLVETPPMHHCDLIAQTRLSNMSRTSALLPQRQRARPLLSTPTDLRRDALTGLRLRQAADGGVAYGRSLSNAVLGAVTGVLLPGTLAQPGAVIQKPV